VLLLAIQRLRILRDILARFGSRSSEGARLRTPDKTVRRLAENDCFVTYSCQNCKKTVGAVILTRKITPQLLKKIKIFSLFLLTE